MHKISIYFIAAFVSIATISQSSEQSTTWLKAQKHAQQANDAFERAHRFLSGWLAYQDKNTKLLPERLSTGRYKWTVHNSAADLYPRMVLAGYFTDRNLLNNNLLEILTQEQLLTNRLGVLPDHVYIDDGSFVYDKIDTTRLIFGASEYCKDGLLMIAEVMGDSPWYDRMVELENAIWDIAPIKSPFGRIPAIDTEVNGEQLMVLTRLYTKTGEQKYLDWARRIGDTYLLHIMPKNHDLPAYKWDFSADTSLSDIFKISDHGNEILGGLALLYSVENDLGSERAAKYKAPLQRALDRLLEIGVNEDGLFYKSVDPLSGQVANNTLTDTWGYVYVAYLAFYQATGDKKYKHVIENVLNRVTNYRGYNWPGDVDGLADCLEGALYLINRIDVQLAWEWIDDEVQRLFKRQQPLGIITGVYNADNSFARVAMMYGRAKTAGTFVEPWNRYIRWGAVQENNRLNLYMKSDLDWSGKLYFDAPRHATIMGMKKNYARLNEFQEWFTVDSTKTYFITGLADSTLTYSGKALIDGIDLNLQNGKDYKIIVFEKEAFGSRALPQYHLYISPQDSLELYTRDVWSKEYLGPGRFVYNDQIYDDVKFRFRGHCYGRGGCKGTKPNKSFKIKFTKQHKFEGVTKNLDINVIWQYQKQQGGVFRSKLPMDVLAMAGYPAPKTYWCEFYLNDVYMGLFMVQEELDSGPFLDNWFGDDHGNLYKFDKVSVDSAGHKRFWREINVEENVDWSDFSKFISTIEIKTDTTFWHEIDQILDVHRFLEHAALNMLCSISDLYNYGRKKDWDTLRTSEVLENPMLYHDTISNKFVLLPWDTNSGLYNPEMELFPRPWSKDHILGYILKNPEWRNVYKSLLKKYLSGIFNVENMDRVVEDIYQDTKEAMKRHNARWMDEYGYYDLAVEKEQIKKFVGDRITYIKHRLWEEEQPEKPPLPFNISWTIDPPLRNGTDFLATTEWGYDQTYYQDRDYVLLDVNPVLYGGVMLKTFNNMKRDSLVAPENWDTWRCTVTADTPVVAYLLWDHRSRPYLPDWLSLDKWSATGEVQQTTDFAMDYFDIFRAYFRAQEPIVLGHPYAAGIPEAFRPGSMYVVVFVPLRNENFPSADRLWQNYPNPFHENTTIPYSLLDPGQVSLELFNLRGQKVRNLVFAPQTPGFYQVVWDGRDENGIKLSSGIYWCRLKVGIKKSKNIKISLLK